MKAGQLSPSTMIHLCFTKNALCCLQELQACPACDGLNWSPPSQDPPSYTQADLADPPASHFWSPESLDTGSTADAASAAAAAAPSEASTPDLQPGTGKGTQRRRWGPKTQVSFQHVWQQWSSLADWKTLLVLLPLHLLTFLLLVLLLLPLLVSWSFLFSVS